jgi:hypothetical protein
VATSSYKGKCSIDREAEPGQRCAGALFQTTVWVRVAAVEMMDGPKLGRVRRSRDADQTKGGVRVILSEGE